MKREVLFFREMGYTAYPQDQARERGYNNLMSGGRVVCGFARGIGQESIATNTNPVYNR